MINVLSVSDTRSVTYYQRVLLLQLMHVVTISNQLICWSSLVFDAGPSCIPSYDGFLRNWRGDVESSASSFSNTPTSVVTEYRITCLSDNSSPMCFR